MQTAYAKVPVFENELVRSVFPRLDKHTPAGGRHAYPIDLELAKFVSVVRDIKRDPAVTAKSTTAEIYKLYPRLRKLARDVLWLTPLKINWDVESPLALIGCNVWIEHPKSKTVCINIGKTVLRF